MDAKIPRNIANLSSSLLIPSFKSTYSLLSKFTRRIVRTKNIINVAMVNTSINGFFWIYFFISVLLRQANEDSSKNYIGEWQISHTINFFCSFVLSSLLFNSIHLQRHFLWTFLRVPEHLQGETNFSEWLLFFGLSDKQIRQIRVSCPHYANWWSLLFEVSQYFNGAGLFIRLFNKIKFMNYLERMGIKFQ